MRRRMIMLGLLLVGLSLFSGCKKEEKEHKGELVCSEYTGPAADGESCSQDSFCFIRKLRLLK